MFKNKIFIFDELNYLLLPLAILIKIFRYKVYFLRLKKNWQNERSINFLKLLGFKWLNYQDFEIKKTAKISKDVVLLQNEFSATMDNSNIANDLKKILISKGCNENDLKSFAVSRLATPLRIFCELILFLDYLKKNNTQNFIIIGQFPGFLLEIFKKKAGSDTLIINLFSFNLLSLLFKIILNKTKSKVKKFFIKKSINNDSKKLDFKKFNTIFFPHHGIYYADIYKKDQFYSKKVNSNFYPSNILHLSIADQHLNSELTKNFYKSNNITNVDFTSLGRISLKEIILSSLSFIKEYYILSKNKLSLIFFFLGLWLSIKRSLNRLDALPNIKSAIFGFDLVSPRDIAIACRIKKIETIATQERFLDTWAEDFFFIFDHYLVFNKDVEAVLSQKQFSSVIKVETIGPIRSDMIKTFSSKTLSKDEKKVLVLDSHSKVNVYGNGRANFSSWKQNYTFYEDILMLAKENSDIKFVIKGKNYTFIDVPYFKKIKQLINQTPNIELYKNKNNSPYELTENSFLTIARYTSFIDELIFKGRSVIIYDAGGYPTELFDYGQSLIVENYEQLKIKFENWKKDPAVFNKNIINESSKYFPIGKPDYNVKDLLHKYMESKIKHYFQN
jgi:hypothetical protein